MNREFREMILLKWEELLLSLFPDGIPDYYEWSNIYEITRILNLVGKDASNHIFLPEGGGTNLSKCIPSHEDNCIELQSASSAAAIIKPKRLVFKSFKNADLEWAFFRIKSGRLEPSGTYSDLTFNYEELTELHPLQYVSRSVWDHGEYNGEALPETARTVYRYFSGDFVIFADASMYQIDPNSYSGIHESLGDIGFVEYIQKLICLLQKT